MLDKNRIETKNNRADNEIMVEYKLRLTLFELLLVVTLVKKKELINTALC